MNFGTLGAAVGALGAGVRGYADGRSIARDDRWREDQREHQRAVMQAQRDAAEAMSGGSPAMPGPVDAQQPVATAYPVTPDGVDQAPAMPLAPPPAPPQGMASRLPYQQLMRAAALTGDYSGAMLMDEQRRDDEFMDGVRRETQTLMQNPDSIYAEAVRLNVTSPILTVSDPDPDGFSTVTIVGPDGHSAATRLSPQQLATAIAINKMAGADPKLFMKYGPMIDNIVAGKAAEWNSATIAAADSNNNVAAARTRNALTRRGQDMAASRAGGEATASVRPADVIAAMKHFDEMGYFPEGLTFNEKYAATYDTLTSGGRASGLPQWMQFGEAEAEAARKRIEEQKAASSESPEVRWAIDPGAHSGIQLTPTNREIPITMHPYGF